MFIACFWLVIAVPESPIWLFEKRKFERLEISLMRIAKINGIKGKEEVVLMCISKLK